MLDLCKIFGVEKGEKFKIDGYEDIYFIENGYLYYIGDYGEKKSYLNINDVAGKNVIKLPKKKEFTDDELCILRNIKSEINTLGRNINGTIYVTSDYGKSYLKLFNNLFQSLDIGEEIIIDDYVERGAENE